MSESEPSDDSLMRLLANAAKPRESKQAFRLLFDRHGGLVLGYCARLLTDRSLAEDVAQDVWMKVIQNADKYEARNQLRPWLLTIARNTSLNILRRQASWVELDENEPQVETTAAPTMLESLMAENEVHAIRRAIGMLPTTQRTAISLLTVEELSYDEIARAMGISLGAVKTHVHRGRLALGEILKSHRGEVK